jgi:hypothetical protein
MAEDASQAGSPEEQATSSEPVKPPEPPAPAPQDPATGRGRLPLSPADVPEPLFFVPPLIEVNIDDTGSTRPASPWLYP